jgi:gliding motility-associated-like protein
MKNKFTFFLSILLVAMSHVAFAQSPGGVSANITSWFRANTPIASNVTIPVPANGKVSQWTSDVGIFSVSQGTTGQQPVFKPTNAANYNFNFNPYIQFSKKNGTVLYNSNTSPDLLSTNGTAFVVINTYNTTADGNPSGFTYFSSNYYQMKPAFRIQTGDGIGGSTCDFGPSAAPTYQPSSALILTSKGVDQTFGINIFKGRRNGDSLSLTNQYNPTYTPAIPAGLFLGSDGTSTTNQNMTCGLAEVITYDTYLSESDENKVETYLAIKYGITLTQQQSTFNQDYNSSNGTLIWSSAANSTYPFDITGIGRDDVSGLMQKQSKSVHNNSLVYLYNGGVAGVFPTSNATNTSTFGSDQSFVLFGDNGLDTTLTQCAFAGKAARMARVWKLQVTGTIDTVTLAFDNGTVSANATNLLVSNDSTFPASATTIYPLTNGSGKMYAAVPLGSNQFFTFASDTLQVNIGITQPSCGGSDGIVVDTITGGVQPYSFLWEPTGQTTQNISGLSAGTYTLAITQTSGCIDSVTVVLNAAGVAATPVLGPVPSICNSGSATLLIQSPQSGVTYNWYNVQTGGTPISTGSTYTTPIITMSTNYYLETVDGACVSNPRIIVSVQVNTPPTHTDSATACGSYLWNNKTYYTSGTYDTTFVKGASNGCDSIAILALTINQPTSSTKTDTACGSYLWNGNIYSKSGTYDTTFVKGGSNGCDSLATLVLTINNADTSVLVKDTCGSYTWNGIIYNASGTYYKLFPGGNSKGCDSTATLVLNVGKTTTSTTTETVCASTLPYTWNGTNYNSSGTYTFTTINANGCDSVATLVLTVTPSAVPAISIATTTVQPSCQGSPINFMATATNGGPSPTYQWQVNGSNQGTNASSFTSATLNNGDVVTCILTSNATCASPATATSTVDTAHVTVFPTIAPITGDSIVCVGDTKTLVDDTAKGIWQSSNTSLATVSSSGVVKGITAGNVTIEYAVSNSCGADSATHDMYVSGIQPNVVPTIKQPTCLYPLSGSITIKISGPEPTYTFTQGGGISYPGDSATISNLGEGTYQIFVFNGNDCLVEGLPTLSLAIDPDNSCDTLYVPTGFMPGNTNTNGLDKLLKPFGGILLRSLSFRVYNRYGNLVFESHDINKGWDGTINGKLQDTGTYVWFLEYTTEGGFSRQSKGTSVLIR